MAVWMKLSLNYCWKTLVEQKLYAHGANFYKTEDNCIMHGKNLRKKLNCPHVSSHI